MKKLYFYKFLLLYFFITFNSISQDLESLYDSIPVYQKLGDLNNAERCIRTARILAKDSYGEIDTLYAELTQAHAICLHTMENLKESEIIFKEALSVTEKLYGSIHPLTAQVLMNFGNLYSDQGRFEEAQELQERALQIKEKVLEPEHPDIFYSLINIAVLYKQQRKYREAELFFKKGLMIGEKALGREHPDFASSLNQLATLYFVQGRFTETEPLFLEAYSVLKINLGPEHHLVGQVLSNIGALYSEIGLYNESERYNLQGLEIYEKVFGKNHSYVASCLSNLAALYSDLGRYRDAEELLKRAIAVMKHLSSDSSKEAITYYANLASLYNTSGRYEEAVPILNDILNLYRIKKWDNDPLLAFITSSLGTAYTDLGYYSKADSLFTEALHLLENIYGINHPFYAKSLSNLARNYKFTLQFEKADSLYEKGVAGINKIYGVDNLSTAKALIHLAQNSTIRENLLEAENYISQADLIYKKHTQIFFQTFSERERELYFNTIKENIEFYNSFYIQRMKENPIVLSEMYDNLINTKGLLFQSTSKIRSHIIQSGNTELIKQYRTWIGLKEYLAQSFSLSIEERKNRDIDLDTLQLETNALERELTSKSEFFAASHKEHSYTWKDISIALQPDEAAVEIVQFRKYTTRITDTVYYAALIITCATENKPAIVLLENGNELENEALDFYSNSIKDKVKETESYRIYWSRISEKLPGIKKIYLSLDGVYNKINLLTLLNPDGKYLVESTDIQLVSNTKDIITHKQRKEPSSSQNTAALFGFPNYDLGSDQQEQLAMVYSQNKERDFGLNPLDTLDRMQSKPLPGTEKEVKEISSLLSSQSWSVKTFTKNDALEEAVKSVRSPRVLHIATHGFFFGDKQLLSEDRLNRFMGIENKRYIENPLLRSGLLFAGAKRVLTNESSSYASTKTDNGILTAYEAMNLDLDSTELVVLSACETGLGVVQNGEGVYGLQRAFLTAGAKNIIMSLWKVNDEVTQQLMVSFYKKWIELGDKRKAFKEAQLEIKKKYPQPFYWGAFVMVGE